MPTDQWSFNSLGCENCCEEDRNCRPYFPCCIRDLSVQADFFVAEKNGGQLTQAVVTRMTLRNNRNSQESVDWSTFNPLNSDLEGGQVEARFGGRDQQGCTFGIDIDLEDIFCPTGQGAQFTVKIKVCNRADRDVDTENDIEVRASDFSMNISFGPSGPDQCVLPLRGADTQLATIAIGEEHEFTIDFDVADWRTCPNQCVTPGPNAIVLTPGQFPADGFQSRCLRPVLCVSDQPNATFEGTAVDSCDNIPPCPPCGCVMDLNGGCACGCGNQESMNACAAPKKTCSGCTSTSGSVTLCESVNNGQAAAGSFVECWTSDCKLAAEIRAPLNNDLWQYIIYGNTLGGGASVTFDESVEGFTRPHCTDFTVEWGETAGVPWIEIDGTRVNGIAAPTDPVTGGTCYIVARGTAFTAA